MGKQYRSWSVEEKLAIVLAVLSERPSVAEIARQHGVNENQIYRWKEQFLAGGRQGLNGTKAPTVDQRLASENNPLKKLLGEKALEMEILKKSPDFEHGYARPALSVLPRPDLVTGVHAPGRTTLLAVAGLLVWVAERFAVWKASVMRWLKRIERKPSGFRRRKLDVEVLAADLRDYPDAYQYERAARLGVTQNAICYALKKTLPDRGIAVSAGPIVSKTALINPNQRASRRLIRRLPVLKGAPGGSVRARMRQRFFYGKPVALPRTL